MKLSVRPYIVLLILIFTIRVYAQDQPNVDSLINVVEHSDDDLAIIKACLKLNDVFIKSDPDTAGYFVNKGLFLAKKNDLIDETGMFYSSLGDIYVIKNNLVLALDNYLNAIELYKVSGNYSGMSNVYLNLGNIYLTQANFSISLIYYNKGIKIADSLKLDRLLPHFYNNLGELYSDLHNYEMAIENYKKALTFYGKKHDERGAAAILNNISQVYIKMKDIKDAEEYLGRAYRIYDSISDQKGLYDVFVNKGNIEELKGNYEQALMNYFEAKKYLDNIGEVYFGPKSSLYAEVYTLLGHCYLEMKDYVQAKKYLTKSIEKARETGSLELMKKATLDISELYEIENNPTEALKYYKLYKKYDDSISVERNRKAITQLNMQNKFSQLLKQKEVETLKYREQQRRKEIWYLVTIAGVVALLIVLGLLFNTQRLKRKNLKLEKQKLSSELDYKNKELTTNVLYLLKKNEFIINISNQLKSLRYSFKPENRKIIDGIIREMEQSASKDIWKEFEVRFQDVHSDFYNKLIRKYPDLSPNELKLCAFLRLNMSTKEISSITFQSYNSIIMARHRLRKKLDISSNENLITFLRQL
jgi:tetratricopeptide (TPR) repeat protein